MKENCLNELIGKKIVAVKEDYEGIYILFDDETIYMQLYSQDAYDYHDCSPTAKEIRIFIDEDERRKIKKYKDSEGITN